MGDLVSKGGGATGLAFARGRIGQLATVMLVHAAPAVLTITVRNHAGQVLAEGTDLRATAETPKAGALQSLSPATGYLRHYSAGQQGGHCVIALTALALPGARERCLTVGAPRSLAKPISPGTQLHRIAA